MNTANTWLISTYRNNKGADIMNIDYKAIIQIKACRNRLTPQQYRTIRGQVLAGDSTGALKGLRKILLKNKEI